MVSVPFRGSCSEIHSEIKSSVNHLAVSVPFRGSCSEMKLDYKFGVTSIAFPSPFGVRVLKL